MICIVSRHCLILCIDMFAIIVSCIYMLQVFYIYIQMEGNTMDEQLQTSVSYFPKDWILGRLGGVSSTADDKSNGNLFVPGSPGICNVVFIAVISRWDTFNQEYAGQGEFHTITDLTRCPNAFFIHNPYILLKQNSSFLDTSNTLPWSLFPQVGHAFLLRQCHPYVQVGSRSCAACHWSFCRSFGKEAWWLVELLVGGWSHVVGGWCCCRGLLMIWWLVCGLLMGRGCLVLTCGDLVVGHWWCGGDGLVLVVVNGRWL